MMMPTLPVGLGTVEVGGRLDLQPRRAGAIDDAVPARDLGAGLREVGLEMASRDVERIDAAGLQVGDVAIAVIDETVDDEGVVVQLQGIGHGVSGRLDRHRVRA